GEDASVERSNETCMASSLQQHKLEKLVANLVPAALGGHPSYLHTFLGTYRALATTQQVLDLLFQRYGCILPYTYDDSGPLHQLKHHAPTHFLGPSTQAVESILLSIWWSLNGGDLAGAQGTQ
ncbi:hypothetical protein CB1_090020001, partial [Camelus ferus]